MTTQLELIDWRRHTYELYAQVRATADPGAGHELWRHGREHLMRSHPQTPLLPEDRAELRGVGYWPYDPSLRFEVPLLPPDRDQVLSVPTAGDGTILLRLAGHIAVPDPAPMRLDVWWLHQYGGGIFIPLRDATAGTASYGGGRYLLDTAKGADLGGDADSLIIDFNFAYHPSCRYNPEWVCPLAPPGNTTAIPIRAGELIVAD